MDTTVQTTAIVRQRGQLTLPDQIRNLVTWLQPNSVVEITAQADQKVVIRPYQKATGADVDWKKIWEKIEIADSFWSKRGNLSQFIIEDRDKRR